MADWGDHWDDECLPEVIDQRITLNGRPLTTDDVEELEEEEDRRA